MNIRKILIGLIIIICAFAIVYGIYFQFFKSNDNQISTPGKTTNESENLEHLDFENLFDNKMNYQQYKVSNETKIDQTKELIFTNYTLTEIYEGKYDVKVNIPIININNQKAMNINKEINSIFMEKVNSIINTKNNSNSKNTIYTVDYTAYLNENILSLVIKSTLKEDNNHQRLIIKSYTYNLSTNEEIPLLDMLEIRGKAKVNVENAIKKTILESIGRTDNLATLGYSVYERDINSTMYKIENSNEYLLGPNGIIYIIYAYGNSSFTSEKDIVVVE